MGGERKEKYMRVKLRMKTKLSNWFSEEFEFLGWY